MDMDKPGSDIRDLTDLPPGSLVYLGEIIRWIATDRGQHKDKLEVNWDSAQRELITKCATGAVIASGQVEGASMPIDEPIDKSIWRRGTVQGRHSLEVSPIDSSTGSEFGGVVSILHENSYLPSKTWSSVGMPVEQVMNAWPPAPDAARILNLRRETVLEGVRRGEVTPDEAEFIARAEGFGPLSTRPASSDFDPFERREWTYEMAIAWIIRGDAEHVRTYWHEYQSEVWSWEESFDREMRDGRAKWIKGFELRQGRVWGFSLAHSVAFEDANRADGRINTPRARADYDGAEASLRARLMSKDIVATAKVLSSPNTFDILPEEWEDIQIIIENPKYGTYGVKFRKQSSGLELHDISFPSNRVVELWPSFASPTPKVAPELSSDGQQNRIAERIRAGGGVSKLTPGQKQIWEAIQQIYAAGGLPVRPQDYIIAIQKNARGSTPSNVSIRRFFDKFGDKSAQP